MSGHMTSPPGRISRPTIPGIRGVMTVHQESVTDLPVSGSDDVTWGHPPTPGYSFPRLPASRQASAVTGGQGRLG